MRDLLHRKPAAMVALLIVLLLSISGLAVAQQGEAQDNEEEATSLPQVPDEATDGVDDEGAEDLGPPFARAGAGDWSPGSDTPPPWAGAEDGDAPPMLTSDWTPGEMPPWVGEEEGDGGPPFLGNEEGWSPTSGEPPPWDGGKPPWAGRDGEDDTDS